MLNTSRKLYAAIAGAILLVAMILSWASTHSSSYEVCRDERYSSSSEKAPDLSKKIAYFFICEGVAIDANGDLITAVATFFMAIFTATLWFVTDKALNLSREEFHATFRPQLEIKFIRRIPESMSVEFSVINTGFGEARFIKGMALYDRMTRDDVTSPFDLQGEKFSLRERFGPSDSDRVTITERASDPSLEATLNGSLYLLGWIVYAPTAEGLQNQVRTTYFGLRFDQQTRNFMPISGDWNFIQ